MVDIILFEYALIEINTFYEVGTECNEWCLSIVYHTQRISFLLYSSHLETYFINPVFAFNLYDKSSRDKEKYDINSPVTCKWVRMVQIFVNICKNIECTITDIMSTKHAICQ